MATVKSTIADNRDAVDAFIATARAVPPSVWTTPPAPGKWSPGQVTEHVAIAYERSREILNGKFAGRSMPRPLRPLIRIFAFQPIVRTGRFRKGVKAPAPFQPTASPASITDLAARLRAAAAAFEADVETAAQQGRTTVDHPFFGRVAIVDYARLQAIHTRHHSQQLGVSPESAAHV
jgi:DinB family protein